jgi:hypothetical protein
MFEGQAESGSHVQKSWVTLLVGPRDPSRGSTEQMQSLWHHPFSRSHPSASVR